MSDRSCRVHIVVDLHYAERIRSLPADEPAWIADSPDNHAVIDDVLREGRTHDRSAGITSFNCRPDDKPDELLISILSAVDLHHGEYSHDPPYSALNIIGTSWSEAIQDELNQFGFSIHKDTTEGFIARRNLRE